MTVATRFCPVCGALEPRVLFRQQFEMTASSPIKGYNVVVCEQCGAGYADGIPDQAVFDQYYRDMSKYEYHQREGAESEYDRARLASTAEYLARNVAARDRRVLDVGCATGRLLVEMRRLGFANVVGLDPSPACAAAAKRLYDIDVRTMTLAELASASDRFDLLIMVGVLEHLRDASVSLSQVKTALNPRGLLYLEVPDATAFADWPNAPYQDFSTEHINFFAPQSLDNLLGLHGFRRVFLTQDHRRQSYATVMSNISALYERSDSIAEVVFDTSTAQGLTRYIDSCALEDARLQRRIERIVDSGSELLIWGVGTHTARLMATSRLAEANIVAFVESNARYHGQLLRGRPVIAPEALKDHREPVLISSRVFQNEIARQIQEDLGCDNELIVLYEI